MACRDLETALMFGDVAELVRLDPPLDAVLLGADAGLAAQLSSKLATAAKSVASTASTAKSPAVGPKLPALAVPASLSATAAVKPAATAAVKPAATAAVKPAATAAVKPAAAAKPAPAATKPAATAAPLAFSSSAQQSLLSLATAKPVAVTAAAKPAATTAATNVFTSGTKVAPTAPATFDEFVKQQAAQNVLKSAPAATAAVAKPAPAATKPAIDYTTGSAVTANFLDPSAGALAAPNVKANFVEGLTGMPSDRLDRAKQQLQEAARATANANVAYTAQRKKELDEHNAYVQRMRTENSPEAEAWRAREKDLATAKTEWEPFARAAGVLATGAAMITTAGAAAGAVGLTAGGASIATAAAADKLLSELEKGGKLAGEAKKVVDEAKSAAAKGDKIAKAAVDTLSSVARERIENAVPKGAVQSLSGQAQAAFDRVRGLVDANAMMPPAQLARDVAAGFDMNAIRQLSSAYGPLTGVDAEIRRRAAALAPSPRWFVSLAGAVQSLQGGVSPGGGRGFVVWNTGEVVAQ